MAHFKYMPEEVTQLQQELKNWPMISAEAQAGKDLPEQLGIIAARLGILLDGDYDIPKLCGMLLKKLQDLRTTNIILPNPELVDVRIKEGANSVTIEKVPLLSPKKGD
jgi:hypothetical protein